MKHIKKGQLVVHLSPDHLIDFPIGYKHYLGPTGNLYVMDRGDTTVALFAAGKWEFLEYALEDF